MNNLTELNEQQLDHLKTKLITDVKKFKGKSRKKKLAFALGTLAKTFLIAGTVTASVFFPPSIVIAAIGSVVALIGGGQSAVNNVRDIKKSKTMTKQVLTELKDVNVEVIRKQLQREILEHPTAPPLYPNLEIAKN